MAMHRARARARACAPRRPRLTRGTQRGASSGGAWRGGKSADATTDTRADRCTGCSGAGPHDRRRGTMTSVRSGPARVYQRPDKAHAC